MPTPIQLAPFYCTTSTMEAITLASCGAEWYDEANPMAKQYSADFLRKNNVTLAQAEQRGMKPQIAYFFKLSDTLTEALKAFREQDELCKAADKTGKSNQSDIPAVNTADGAKIICAALHNRRKIMDRMLNTPPKLVIERDGGCFTVIGKNTPADVKARFNVA